MKLCTHALVALALLFISITPALALNDSLVVTDTGQVGIGTDVPAAKLEVAGDLIRTIAYATANGPKDYTDVGQIVSRVLSFTKAKTDSKIRIGYTDNFRTRGTTGTASACRWEIRIDGNSCSSQALIYDFYSYDVDNNLRSASVTGYCSGIATGSHTIEVWVSAVPGYACTPLTGWNESTWVIEAEEVN